MPRFEEDDISRPLTIPVAFGQSELMASDEYARISPKHKTDEAVRVAVVGGTSVLQAWVHTVFGGETQGVFHCLSEHGADQQIVGQPAACCAALNDDDEAEAKRVFGITVVHYLDADPITGRFDSDAPLITPFRIGWMRLTNNAYASISRLFGADDKGPAFDFVIKARGSKTVGYDYIRPSRKPPRYTADPTMKTAVLEAASLYRDGKQLQRRLGKVLPAAEFANLLGAKKADASYEGGE